MPLLRLEQLTFAYSHPPLLDHADLTIDSRERIGLVGRNGAGKSTFLKLLAGMIMPDDGQIIRSPEATIARLSQDVDDDIDQVVSAVIAHGLPETGDSVARFFEARDGGDHSSLEKMEAELTRIEAWSQVQQVEKAAERMELPLTARFSDLSTGLQRRVLLAQAVASDPTVLLLDEPTNHLDIPTIDWLERFLSGFQATIIFITHDRVFLQKLATRIVEVDRGKLFDWTCDYKTFLERRDAQLAAEEKQWAEFDRKLAEEERWIRQGIKARRTRNEGRVRALKELRVQRSDRRQRLGTVKLQQQDTAKSGTRVIRVRDLKFDYGEQPLVNGLDFEMQRGDRVGLVGPNGAGKSTLLKLLLGELKPHSGTVEIGTNLEIAYFDQNRKKLDPEKTAVENLGAGADWMEINGQRRAVLGYLQDFLFSPERARTLVRFLSGGEQNRLLLASVLARPSNLLVLDEPTNDLDTETLELLEEFLLDYSGSIIVVSHDRAFLNQVVTSTLVFEEPGQIVEYDGGYDDWQRVVQQREVIEEDSQPVVEEKKPDRPARKKSSLSYRETQELESLPETIARLEAEIESIHQAMQDPEYYQRDKDEIAKDAQSLATTEESLTTAYARWEELEGKASE